MSANELRQAADTLRERAGNANVGPWEAFRAHDGHPGKPDWIGVTSSMDPDVFSDQRASADDATYIATVHPGVGLALADWLDHIGTVTSMGHPVAFSDDALNVARLINGDAS